MKMKFQRTAYPPSESSIEPDTCYLVNNNWDDFGFKTSFGAVLYDKDRVRHELGWLRILKRGLSGGVTPLPTEFETLDREWCSLGDGREYYLQLSKLNDPLRTTYLTSVRDCVHDNSIFKAFKDEDGMQSSLLRTVTPYDVQESFPRILRGDSQLTPYEFIFEFVAGEDGEREKCAFVVQPDSLPPTNIHVLIGRNGVGKTRLLAGMVDALTRNRFPSVGIRGQFKFADDSNEFSNVVVVSYSAFDRFDPLNFGGRRSRTSIPYYYIGIKKRKERPELGDTPADSIVLKEAFDFNFEFQKSLQDLADQASKRYSPARYRRWIRALSTLKSDPGLADFAEHLSSSIDSDAITLSRRFERLSSGHKIVLLTVAQLVQNVSDRSIVLMDEPETHLHPPLLGSFVRAVSELLTSLNGVAIVATHSPVVLQEVPARCVSIIKASGRRIRVGRPKTETFAENVGMLTRRVFGLEVEQSGFYRLLKDASKRGDFNEVINDFKNQVGGEGRALARSFTHDENDDT